MNEHVNKFDETITFHTKITRNGIGPWGVEHIKGAFEKDVKPFAQTLKEYFHMFEHGLYKELKEMKYVFNQLETKVAKCFVDKKYFEIEKKEISLENDRLLEHIICQDVMNIVTHADSLPVNVLPVNNKCLVNDNLEIVRLEQENDHLFELFLSQDIVHICVNSLATLTNYAKMEHDYIDEYSENLMLKAELAKKEHMVEKKTFDEVVIRCLRLENCGANPELKLQHQKESFMNNISFNNQNAPVILEIFKINEWQAKLDAKDVSIANLRKHIKSLKGKNVLEKDVQLNNPNVIAPRMFKLDLEPLAPRVLNNKDAHIDYIKHSLEHADTLLEIRSKNKKTWKPTGKVFTDMGYRWKPTGRTFTIEGNTCPLTRITSTKVEPLKETTSKSVTTPNPEIKIYRRKTKVTKSVVQIILWYLDSGCSKHMTGNLSQLINFVHKFLGTVRFGNDQIAKFMGYGDYQLGNVTISRVYYVEGLGHNLFSMVQFCDSNLEVVFRKHTCYVWNLDGADLLSGSRDTNLYTISLDDMLKSSLIFLLCKASKTKSFTWVKFLISKNEAPEVIIKCLMQIQVRLNATVKNVRTDNGTEFVNQTLKDYYENVGISHQTSIARTPQQNGVVERWNRTLVEAARTMLIFFKAQLYLWVEGVSTACYTQNRSLIRLRYNKTPYEIMHEKKPDLSFLHVFGSLCYPTNDCEDLGKLKLKADIGIFVGYAPTNKSFRIYNKRTRQIMETIHVMSDELTAMASEQFSSGLAPQLMTPGTLSSGLFFNPPPSVVSPVPVAAAPRPVDPTGSPVSTSIDQDAPSTSNPSTQEQEQSPIISQGVEESPKTPHFHDDPLHETLYENSTSQGSSSNVRSSHTLLELLGKWIKNHPLANVIGDPSRSSHKLEAIHIFIANDANKNMTIYQMDVKTAFLNDELREVVYAPRAWYDMLSSFLLSQEFSKGAVDPTLFIRKAGRNILLVQIYVDDIIFASTNPAMCNEFDKIMSSKFTMSMMGKMSFFLRLQISQSPRCIFINQSNYALEIIKKYGMQSSDPIDTPTVDKSKLDEDLQGKPVDPTHYRVMIGSLMYLTSN
ncbi:retrovirus-related pol polyprotein from transposon TNT 1-94 [Tanacetum coccineum]